MKPDNQPWCEYLRGYAELRWRSPGDEQKYHEISGLLQTMYDLYWSSLLNRTGPKIVFAVPTPYPVQKQGHPAWTFKAQCLVTGRISTAIPYERMPEFGILREDLRSGGAFPKKPQDVIDRVKPYFNRLQREIERFRPTLEVVGTSWHERYSEYLRSDEWLDLRRRVLIRDRFRCQWTGKASRPGDPLQVHHLTYARIGDERMEDLITVCRSAHASHHKAA